MSTINWELREPRTAGVKSAVFSFQSRCTFVLLSSVADALLAWYYRQSIFDLEQNPICLLLMELEPNQLSVFMVVKFLMTLAVIFVIVMLKRRCDRMGSTVCSAIALFQLSLLTYQFAS